MDYAPSGGPQEYVKTGCKSNQEHRHAKNYFSVLKIVGNDRDGETEQLSFF